MLSAKLITHRSASVSEEKFKQLTIQFSMFSFQCSFLKSRLLSRILIVCGLQLMACSFLIAQDNSPYSRYGIGDLHPTSHILNRGMAGLSAGFADQLSVNFSNPASYSSFYSLQEARSKKSAYGRMLLDVGLNFDNRTLREPNNPQKFTAPNAYFSYLQMGIPLRKNWGMVLGLRPVSRISYDVFKKERLTDPNTGLPIDSAITQFYGDGGSYLVNTGAGYAIKNFSMGFNAGYLFGKKDYSTRRTLLNDSVAYKRSNHQTRSTFGDLFLNMGLQYRIDLNKGKTKYLQLGLTGNLKHELNARRDIIRETYFRFPDGGEFRQDSVSEQLDIKGIVNYPASFTAGFLFEQLPDAEKTGWLFGIDYTKNNWDDYRFYGQLDSVKSNWQLKIGGQLKPSLKETKYKNLISYRAGVFFGNDYIHLNQKLPELGITGGISLPIANLKDAGRRFRTQYSVINISAEYIKRGNKDNILRENLFRVSVGFSLSDLWFTKRKYD